MIWRTAWKNVWRNPVRSIVVIASVTIGIFAGVFSIAFMNGMIAQRINSAINEEISHIQITGKDFRLNNDPKILVANQDSLIQQLPTMSGIAGMVNRTIISGMAGTATKSAGVQIVGIDPEKEKTILTLDRTIMPGTGDYFNKESKYELALIGQDLAKELGIIRYSIDSAVIVSLGNQKISASILEKLTPISGIIFKNEKKFVRKITSLLSKNELKQYGSRIKKEAWSFREGSRMTLTFLDKDDNQVGAVFRLTGIYDVENTMFEQSMVFVKDADLKRLTGIDNGFSHQIVIKINDINQTVEIAKMLKEKLPAYDIVTWKELQPDLAMMTDYVHQMYAFFMAIILAALAFGIINTMLMVVLERTKELGMLTAIGMNKKRVFSMIMLESVFLSIIGGVAGMIVGWVTVVLTAQKGINFAQYAEGLEAFGYSAHVFPEISASFFIMITIMIILTGIISSVYPALKALKLDPAEAIRTE